MVKLAMGACVILVVLTGCDQMVDAQMDDIYKQVADDAVAQYQITKQSGNPIDQCVHAGLVAAAFLQAQDQGNYARWKAIENVDCAAAGVPR